MGRTDKKDLRQPLLTVQEISDDLETEGKEPSGPDKDVGGPSNRSGGPANPHVSSSSNLSFFDDYDIVDGIPRTTVDMGFAVELERIKFSKNGCGMTAVGGYWETVWIFHLYGRRSAECLDPGKGKIFDICFDGDSDNVVLCLFKNGELARLQREPNGEWAIVMEVQLPLPSEMMRLDFSNDGEFVAGAFKVEKGYSVAWYDIRDIPTSVMEVKKVKMDDAISTPMEFSPNGRGFLLRRSKLMAFPDFSDQDVAFKLTKGDDGRWFGNDTIVTWNTKGDESYVWRVGAFASSVEQSSTRFKIKTYERDPDMTFRFPIMGISGDRVFVYEGDDMSVWDMSNGSILGRVVYRPRESWSNAEWNHYACMSENGKWLAVLEEKGGISIWDARRCVKVWETQLPEASRKKMDKLGFFTNNGNKVIFGCQSSGNWVCYEYHVDVLEGKDEAIYDCPDGYGIARCQFSSDGSKIGMVVIDFNVKKVLIWNVNANTTLELSLDMTNIEQFCFSIAGDRVLTISFNGLVALWNVQGVSGVLTNYTEVCNVREVALRGIEGWRFTPLGISFTRDTTGQEMVAVLTDQRLIWIDMDGELVFTVEIDVGRSNGYQFSANGDRCLLLCAKAHTLRIEVWDVVQRQRLEILEAVSDMHKGLLEPTQISIDGRHAVVGVRRGGKPWLIPLVPHFKHKDFKMSDECSFQDYERHKVFGPIGALSEDGKHVATCARVGEFSCKVTLQRVADGDDGSSRHARQFDFNDEGVSGRLIMSHNGQRVAWVTAGRIRVWGTFCDDRCIPTYPILTLRKQSRDNEKLSKLLGKHGMHLLIYPNGGGSTLLSSAVEDRNTEWVRMITEWARANDKSIPMNKSNLKDGRGDGLANIVQLSLKARLPDCTQILMDAALDGTLEAPNKEEILGEALGAMINVYPRIVVDAMCDSRMLHEEGEIWYPRQAFEQNPFLVCTTNDLHPENLQELWSKPIPSFAHTRIWCLCKCCVVRKKKREFPEGAKKVPAKSYVIPIHNFAQIGKSGMLGRVLGKDVDQNVFEGLPIKAMIDFKWQSHGRDLVIDDFCFFAVLFCFFTAFAVVLGIGCQTVGGLTLGYWIACVACLVVSVLINLLRLCGKLKQLAFYCKRGRGFWFYWCNSKWNAWEFLTYILIMFAVPTFFILSYLFGGPCQCCAWGLSWAIPVVEILLGWKLLYFALPFHHTGPIVLMVFAIMKDITFFLSIGLGVFLCFGVGFFVVFRSDDEDGHENIGKLLLATFAMLFGNFDLDVLYDSHDAVISILLFVGFMLVMAVVLLNMLIAIMVDSVDRSRDREEHHLLMARAGIIDDMEIMLSRHRTRRIRRGIQRYLHVLLPKNDIEEFGQWHGKIRELKKYFRRVADQMEAGEKLRIDVLERTMQRMLDDQQSYRTEQDGKLDRKIDTLEATVEDRTRDVESNLEKAMDQKLGRLERMLFAAKDTETSPKK